MYIVPMEPPEACNKCPFGYCQYSFPSFGGKYSISSVDGKENKTGTYGYVCNIDFQNNGRYTKVLRAECGNDIKKPKWCGLREVKENANIANQA